MVEVAFDADAGAWVVGAARSGPAGAAKLALSGDADLWVDRSDSRSTPWLLAYSYEGDGVADSAAVAAAREVFGTDVAEALRDRHEGPVAVDPGTAATRRLLSRLALALDLWNGGDLSFPPPLVVRAEIAAYAFDAPSAAGLRWAVDAHRPRGIVALLEYDPETLALQPPHARQALAELAKHLARHLPGDDARRLEELAAAARPAHEPQKGRTPLTLLAAPQSEATTEVAETAAAARVVDVTRQGHAAVLTVETEADAGRQLWARATDGASGALLALAPLRQRAGEREAHATLPLPRDRSIDEIRFEVTVDAAPASEDDFPRGARGALLRGAMGAGAERRGDTGAAFDAWLAAACAWQEVNEAGRAAEAYLHAASAAQGQAVAEELRQRALTLHGEARLGQPHEPLLAERIAAVTAPAVASSSTVDDELDARRRLRVRTQLGAQGALAAGQADELIVGSPLAWEIQVPLIVDEGSDDPDWTAHLEASLGRTRTIDLAQLGGPPLRVRGGVTLYAGARAVALELPGKQPLARELEALLSWADG